MELLSEKLTTYLDKNNKANGRLSGSIEKTETEFLMLKHSLDVIHISKYNLSAYILGLKLHQLKEEQNELFDKKVKGYNKDTVEMLEQKINIIDSEYLAIKRELQSTTFTKNLKYI